MHIVSPDALCTELVKQCLRNLQDRLDYGSGLEVIGLRTDGHDGRLARRLAVKTNKKSLDSAAMEKPESIVPAWEFALLVALMVTVFGLTSSSTLKTFPNATSSTTLEQALERDPYDIQPERKLSDARPLVEIGL